MAIEHYPESYVSASTTALLARRVVLGCAAGLAIVVMVNILAGTLVDHKAGKVQANRILSPWDKATTPPPMVRPSHIIVKPMPVETQQTALDEPQQGVRHHRWWRHARHRHARTRLAVL